MWVVEDINSINTDEAKDLLIMQLDRHYCFDCTYLIGIVTHEQRAQYSLYLETLLAEKNYPHLLRLGVTKHIKVTDSQKPRMF